MTNPFLAKSRKIVQGENVGISEPGPPAAVFISGAALLSFPVALGVIKLAPLIALQFSSSVNTRAVILIVSVAIGAVIFFMNVTNIATRPKTATEWVVAFVIGIINTGFLLAAALGINVGAVFGSPSPGPPPPTG